MANLKWGEISIVFTELEAVRIRARGTNQTFTYDAMGFKNRGSLIAKPNATWQTLLTLAIISNTARTLSDESSPQINFKRRVSRLRDCLQSFFGISDDPISYHRRNYHTTFALGIESHVEGAMRERIRLGDGEE
jgi:hypothetical protein